MSENQYIPILRVCELLPDGQVSARDCHGHVRIVMLSPSLIREKVFPGCYVTVYCRFVIEIETNIPWAKGMMKYLRERP